jgi:hypothetical protein
MIDKHTPGPWKIRRNQSTNKPSLEVESRIDRQSICFLSKGDLGLSDAQLIKSAPDLQQALQWLCEELEDVYDVPEYAFKALRNSRGVE